MCTLSLITHAAAPDGPRAFRLVANRDEQRTRPLALPARVVVHEGLHAWWPIDAQSGGTWIGVNAAGLAMGLLNFRAGTPTQLHAAIKSRGLIIPSLLASPTLSIAAEGARSLRARDFLPFRLIITDGHAVAQMRSDGQRLTATDPAAWGGEARMWTSSSLGDQLVQGPRRELFDRVVASDPSAATQDSFHLTRWHDLAHLSPMMERAEARTVSVTTIDITLSDPPTVRCTEEAVPRSICAQATALTLPPRADAPSRIPPYVQPSTHHQADPRLASAAG